MADLRDYIDSYFKEPTATVKFNGQKARNILSIESSCSLEDSIASATIQTITRPDIAPEARVIIYEGYNRKEQTVFTGLVDTIERNVETGVYTISCRDLLKKAIDTFLVQEVKFGIDVDTGEYYYSTYTGGNGGEFTVHKYPSYDAMVGSHPETAGNYSGEGVKAEAVVQWLLVMSGLAEGKEIKVDDTNFWIGDLKPAAFHLMSVYDAIQQIGELIGWYVFCDPGGVVRFKKRPTKPSGYVTWTYSTRKGNIHSLSHVETNTDLRNYVEVHGASGIKVVERAASPYLGTTPYRGVVIGNDLIDTSGIALFIASRMLRDLNRLRHTVNLEVDGNPYVFPGQSVKIDSSAATGVYMVDSISSTISAEGGYKLSMAATAYPDSNEDDEEEEDIEAAFTTGTVVSLGDPKILVQFDGSSSYSNRGLLNAWEWDFPGSLTPPVKDTQPVTWAAYDMAVLQAGVTVNLKVRDSIGNVAITSSGITLSGILGDQEILYRHLYAALTTKAAGSQDGGETWNIAACPAISAAASSYASETSTSPVTYALFGGSDGKIYKTTDQCNTVTPVFTAGGRVTSVHIPETNASLALAATSEGNLYRSNDSGESWQLVETFNAPLRHAEFGFRNHDYITVVASGNPPPGAYVSSDGGVSWARLTDFGPVDMQWYSAGASTPYWAHASGIVASVPQPKVVEFSGGAGPFVVGHTVMLDRDDGVMAADSTGQLWTAASGTASGVMMPTQSMAGNNVRHMVRDGDIPLVVYYATQEGVYKSLDRNTTTMPLLTFSGEAWPTSPPGSLESHGWGEMVAYGPLAPIIPPVVGRLVLQGSSVVDDVVTLSGYTTAGIPVYTDATTPTGGLFVAVGSGTTLCIIQTTGATANNRVVQAGPSYLVTIGDANMAYTGPDMPAFPSEVKGRLNNLISVVDFTTVATSGAKFYPVLKPVGYYPKETITSQGEHKYAFTSARLSTKKHLGNSNQVRIITTVQRTRHLGFDLYGGDEVSYESVDATPAEIENKAILDNRVHFVELGWGGGVYYGTQQATVGPSSNDSVIAEYFGGHPMSRTTQHALIEPDTGGTGTTVTPMGSFGGDESVEQRLDLRQKMPSKWRALARRPADGKFVVITGPSSPGDISQDLVESPEAVVDVGTSAAVKSDIYVAAADRLYKVASYGAGAADVIWEMPDQYLEGPGIVSVSITHDRAYRRDYVALLVCTKDQGFGGGLHYVVFLSQDNGNTWAEYGPYRTSVLGGFSRAWWVDS